MKSYSDIPGWFDFESVYAEQVRRAKDGARFVEVGCWQGRSTAYLAQKIKESEKDIKVFAVDTWAGSSPDRGNHGCVQGVDVTSPAVLYETFLQNMRDCGVSDCVIPIRNDSVAVAQSTDYPVDFVFIDGDHATEKVYADLCAWWPRIRPGGLLAGHDYELASVKEAVHRFVTERNLAVYGDGVADSEYGYHCYGIPKLKEEPVNILLGLPTYNGQSNTEGLIRASTCAFNGNGSVAYAPQANSVLTQNFNALWCRALNDPEITHFAMLHADIVPLTHWFLNVLLHELDAEEAQLVSTIVPIKDSRGVTSCGLANPALDWAPLRRYTMREVMNLPATFSPELVGGKLVLNTGCWLADMRDARWKLEDENGDLIAHFSMRDRIRKHEGMYLPWCEPEDFFFSKRVQSLGMKVLATRKVQVEHIGDMRFPNSRMWGTWEWDEDTEILWKKTEDAPAQKLGV